MKNKHKVLILLGAILLVTIISISTIIASTPPKDRKIKIGTAYSKNLAQTVVLEGVVEPNRKQVIDLDTSQKVVDVFTGEGQEIKKGELILKLDSSESQHKLNIEKINLELAEKELNKAIRNEKIDRKDVEYSAKQAENALSTARNEFAQAKQKNAGDKILYEKGAISKLDYDESINSLKKYENAMIEKEIEWERAKNTLDNYGLSREDKIFELRSNISLIEENIKDLETKIDSDTKANIDGRVVKLEVEKDQYPSEDATQILVYDMSKYIINAQVKQKDALYLKEGMKAKIKVIGLDGKEYDGTITDVDDVALNSGEEGREAKVGVRVEIDNPDDRIKIGYETEVSIKFNMKPDAVVVDFESIVQDNDGKKYIYYVKDDMATKVPVKTGVETSFEVEIQEGLIKGDKYIINPPEDMQEKDSVRIWGWRYE